MTYNIEITQAHIDKANSRWVRKHIYFAKSKLKNEYSHYHESALLNETTYDKSLETFMDGCPLENAINEVLGKSSIYIPSDCKSLHYWNGDTLIPTIIPITYNRALDFLKRHRTGKSVKPFTFIFEV
jgi:hypothetical protein